MPAKSPHNSHESTTAPSGLPDGAVAHVVDQERQPATTMPVWLTASEDYHPGKDRDSFIVRTFQSISAMLAFFRLDDGHAGRFSPSAPVKIVLACVCILLVSLSHNAVFVVTVLAGVLVRACLLPHAALVRMSRTAVAAGFLMFVLTLPSVLLGQPKATVLLALKALVCTGTALTVALTTPPAELTSALRFFHVPSIVILTFDLTLRSIVALGTTALEALTALRLRSVGTNRQKRASAGGVAGVVLLKASALAQDTYDAMRCRGFDGTYQMGYRHRWRAVNVFWLALLALLICLFIHLQGVT